MQLDFRMAFPLILAGAAGSFVGARLATKQIPEAYLRKILLAVVLGATLYRLARLLF
jgi:uncharacterized membrane protein YfcA